MTKNVQILLDSENVETGDQLMRVEVLSQTLKPQQLIYAAMHQDYSANYVYDEIQEQQGVDYDLELYDTKLLEGYCGNIVVDRLLKGNKGHYGCFEHPSISFACGYIPHSVMQQVRTHRVGISFDVQSFRYSSESILKAATQAKDGTCDFVEQAFYVRPVGEYRDRQGGKYEFTENERHSHLNRCLNAAIDYKLAFDRGMSEEHARGMLSLDYRQHFVVSFNARSLMHFLDLRSKKNAQLECQWLCDLILPHFREWMPEVADWYIKNRLQKGVLAP